MSADEYHNSLKRTGCVRSSILIECFNRFWSLKKSFRVFPLFWEKSGDLILPFRTFVFIESPPLKVIFRHINNGPGCFMALPDEQKVALEQGEALRRRGEVLQEPRASAAPRSLTQLRREGSARRKVWNMTAERSSSGRGNKTWKNS